jgi:hypothetical protein
VRRAARLIVFYTLATVVMTWPIFNIAAAATASYEGDARLMIWALGWDNHAVLDGASLFDANMFYPAPNSLAFTEHSFGISLFTLPIFALTRNAVLAYNVVWFLSYVLCGLATHAWLRRYTRHDLAACIGSVIFTFSFYKMLHGHGHLQQIWTWLLPLSLLQLERWFDRPSPVSAVAWGSAVLLQALSSWYLAILVFLANGFIAGWRIVAGPRLRTPGSLVQLAVVFAAVLAVLYPFAAHYRTLAPVTSREVRSLAADASSYLMPPENTWPGRVWLARVGRGPGSIFGEKTVYIGWIALLLAAMGVVRATRWREAGGYVILAVVALFLSLGPPAQDTGWSAYSIAARLPLVGGFRAPARFALLVLLGVSVLATIGVDELLELTPRSRRALMVVLPLMLSEWFVIGFPGKRPQPFPVPAVYLSDPIKSARAIVSLPDYRGDVHWFWEADYLLFSTRHWRPMVNGYGRYEPPQHAHDISYMMAFPGPNNARRMRELGVEYLVLHAARYPDGAATILRDAQASPEYELVMQQGTDYLYRVR